LRVFFLRVNRRHCTFNNKLKEWINQKIKRRLQQ